MKPAKGDPMENRDHPHRHQEPVQGNLFEPLLDSTEAAELLKIHPKTLQKMARKGEITAVQIGKLWRFRASALNEWLEKIAS
jgi:excisionase family DNA binding protein